MKKKPQFVRFNDLTSKDINRDYQIHTNWTDGDHSAIEIILAAENKQLSSIAFTEHIRGTSTYYDEFFCEIDNLRKDRRQMEIYIGIEAKVINTRGELDISKKHYDLAEIILGSVHRIPQNGEFISPKKLGGEKTFEEECLYSLAMIEGGLIDVLAHPFGMSISNFGELPDKYLERCISVIAKTNIAFELNSKYMTPEYLKKSVYFCRQYNPFISIGSDVHKIEELGASRAMLAKII